MYNGFDEDAQVFSCLPGLVSFEADAQACRTGVVKGHLEHELLLPALRNKACHTGHLVLLRMRERVMEVEGDVDEEERRVGTG